MSCYQWSIKESYIVGIGKTYELTEKGLIIGRDSKCDIVIHSKSVDPEHAIVEWNRYKQQYTIRDLNTVNGTFVNQFPLRGSSKLLEQRDSIKFGYSTDQVFRIDLTVSTIGTVAVSTTSTQTSPSSNVHVPVQYVPSVIVSTGTNISHVIPQVVSVVTLPEGVISTLPSVTLPEGVISTLPSVTLPEGVISSVTLPEGVISTLPSVVSTTPSTVITRDKTVQAITDSSPQSGQRTDGRKSIPQVSAKGSPLYGCPSWWGEDEQTVSDSELIPHGRRLRSEVIKDLDVKSEDESTRFRSRSSHLMPITRTRSNSMNALTEGNSCEEEEEHKNTEEFTTFTVEFGAPKRSKPKISRPASFGGRPASFAGNLDSLKEPSRTRSSLTPPSSSQRTRSQKKRSSSVYKPPPSGSAGTSDRRLSRERNSTVTIDRGKPKTSRGKVKTTTATSEEKSTWRETTYTVKDDKQIDLDDTTLVFHSPSVPLSDSSFHSQFSSTHSTPYHSNASSRQSSARKQWNDKEVPHGLILASIETRLKRLADSASSTASNVTQFIDCMKEQNKSSSSVSSLVSPLTISELPQWTIDNKEYAIICQYITASEESLRAIHKSLVQLATVERDETDYHEGAIQSDSLEESQTGSSSSNPLLLVTEDRTGDSGSPLHWEEEDIERTDSDLYYSASSEADDD